MNIFVAILMSISPFVSVPGKTIRPADESVNVWNGEYAPYSMKGITVGKQMLQGK